MKELTLKSGKTISLNQAFNMDCLEFMNELPDKCIDLVLTDPPYGIGEKLTSGGTWASKYSSNDSKWDIKPAREYFDEIIRISKNYIIWGGNYFSDCLPPSRCFITWRKVQMLGMHTMADAELALTSFDKNAKIYDCNNARDRIHITQKPIELFDLCLRDFSEKGFIVFDPFLGSFTTSISANNSEMFWLGCEMDSTKYTDGYQRYEQETKQMLMEF